MLVMSKLFFPMIVCECMYVVPVCYLFLFDCSSFPNPFFYFYLGPPRKRGDTPQGVYPNKEI